MDNTVFLQDLSVVLLIAGLVTVTFHYLKQPVILGYILAGFLIGPHTPPFPLITSEDSINTLSQLGVVMLMFSLGIQLSFRGLMKVGPTASIAAILEIGLMVFIGYHVGLMFGWKTMDSIFLGAILLSSSTVIIVKSLNDLRIADAPFAKFIFGILVLDDMAAILAITVLSGIALSGEFSSQEMLETGWKIGLFFTAVLVGGLLLLPRLLRFVARFKNDEVMIVLVLGLAFGISLLAVKLGFSTALGAFLLGSVIAETREGGRIRELIAPIRDMFSAVFFVSIGLLVDPALIVAHWLPILVITVVLIVGKTLTGALGAFVAGNGTRTSLRIGLGLAQIGEFAFIIAALGQNLGETSDFLYPIAVSVSAITTLTTPFLIKYSDTIAEGLERLVPRRMRDVLNLYARWVSSMSGSPRSGTQARVLLRKWFVRMGLNMALVTVIFVIVTAASPWVAPTLHFVPRWLGGSNVVLFFAALLLSMPLLIATMRKMRAAARLMAELSITRGGTKEQLAVMRSVVTNLLVAGAGIAVTLYILMIASTILPSTPMVVALMLVGACIALWQWRAFVRVYAKAEGSLRETLEAIPEPTTSPTPAMQDLLRHAVLETVIVPDTSHVRGKAIRELQLRVLTGANIVGIERGSQNLINPDPNELLQVHDRVLLVGYRDQVTAARNLILSDAARPSPPTPASLA